MPYNLDADSFLTKYTFAVSSPDEFLVSQCTRLTDGRTDRILIAR